MYPFVMSASQYYFLIHTPTILIKGRDELINVDNVFGVVKVKIQAPDDQRMVK